MARGFVDDPLFPADVAWRPVAPGLRRVRLTLLWLAAGPIAAGLAVAAALANLWALGVGAAAATAVAAIATAVISRQVAAIGYAEDAAELLIRRGALIRRLVVMPYPRLQFVDVTAGPLARWFRIATVEIHTAALGMNVTIPGLPPAEAAELRARLVARGEAGRAGL
jgi:membrane protein YdbS with pleckstrin-like domain